MFSQSVQIAISSPNTRVFDVYYTRLFCVFLKTGVLYTFIQKKILNEGVVYWGVYRIEIPVP